MSIFSRFNRHPQSTEVKANLKSGRRAFEKFLKSNNIFFEAAFLGEDKTFCRYDFDFQGGHFLALVLERGDVLVMFPRIFEVDINHLSLVRALCNAQSMPSNRFHLNYHIDDETHCVNVNAMFYLNVVEPECLMMMLVDVFRAQREFIDTYETALKEDKGHSISDPERLKAGDEREVFLLRQQEINHQSPSLRWRTSDTSSLGLLEFVETLLSRHDIKISRLTIGDRTVTDNVAQFDLISALKQVDPVTSKVSFAPLATGFVYYALTGEKGRDMCVMPLIWRYEDFDGSSHYVRISATIEPESVRRDHSENANGDYLRPEAISILVAYDLESPEKKLQELDFMWKDAKDKIRDGQQDQLTDQQQLIYDIDEPNLAYCLYWGRNCMSHKRYYEALRFFRNAFATLRLDYFNLREHYRKVFFDVCYYIGFCYCDLGFYELAYYYLDIVGERGRIEYAEEYVNALANAGDLRVFSTISDIFHDIEEAWDLSDDIPEKLQSFIGFLRRRKAFSDITFGNLDEAEKQFKSMLDEPENRDYALSELAYIRQVRKQEGGDRRNDKPADEKA